MIYFTPEDFEPSEKTLNAIRQFAHSYRIMNRDGQELSYSIN